MPGFIIDLDGTMYAGKDPVPGAGDFIRELRGRGLPYLFLTNNSSKHPDQVARHLADMTGLEVDGREVLTSAMAAARYIAERSPGSRVFPVGEEGLKQALQDAGLQMTEEEQPDYVVQGIDREFTYRKLEQAVRFIRGGSLFIQTNPDHLLPTDGKLIPGAGSIAAAIRTASEAEPVVIGKPSPIILRYGIEQLGLPASDIWVIGDNLRTDIAGGAAAGCRTVLPLTGLATPDNVDSLIREYGITPDVICSTLPDLLNHF